MILVLNSGSETIKYKLFGLPDFKVLKEGHYSVEKREDYKKRVQEIFNKIENSDEIQACGHRVVHGGNQFTEPTLIDNQVIEKLESLIPLAPLHNPANIAGIKAAQMFSDAPQVAVFDTGFYKTLPQKAYVYALPRKLTQKLGLRRFGFHGISHEHAAKKAAQKLGKEVSKINLITLHLGGGASATAIKEGQAIDTSMGFTPLEGLVMMTRSGDLDPGLIFHLQRHFGFNQEAIKKVKKLLNWESGMKGLSGVSDQMLDILKAEQEGDQQARLALEVYIYRIQKYIGAYFAILGQIDGLVFTGAIGQNKDIQNRITQDLPFLEVPVIYIPTNEELAIAQKIFQNFPQFFNSVTK